MLRCRLPVPHGETRLHTGAVHSVPKILRSKWPIMCSRTLPCCPENHATTTTLAKNHFISAFFASPWRPSRFKLLCCLFRPNYLTTGDPVMPVTADRYAEDHSWNGTPPLCWICPPSQRAFAC